MPELPDIDLYVEALDKRVNGHILTDLEVQSPFVLRSVDPPIHAAAGRRVTAVRRIGKRVAIGLESDLWLVMHLMVAGRLRWYDEAGRRSGRQALATFRFETGTLLLTEAGSRKKASLHLVQGAAALAAHDPGGIEVLEAGYDAFAARLAAGNHTLKRALTNPALFSGIGNAYSDEILHAAKLSPAKLTGRLTEPESRQLYAACRDTLRAWRERLRRELDGRFPDKVTAFRADMAVHGKFGQACPVCGTRVARIRYKRRETNYCPGCQTGGRLLADRSLSRLLRDDWPDAV